MPSPTNSDDAVPAKTERTASFDKSNSEEVSSPLSCAEKERLSRNPPPVAPAKSLYRESLNQYLKEQQEQHGISAIKEQLKEVVQQQDGDGDQNDNIDNNTDEKSKAENRVDETSTAEYPPSSSHGSTNKGEKDTTIAAATTSGSKNARKKNKNNNTKNEDEDEDNNKTENNNNNDTTRSSSTSAVLPSSASASSSQATGSNPSPADKQTIRGRRFVSDTIIETEHGEIPAKEYFNIRHRLRNVSPIEESLSLFQLWVMTPLLNTFMWLLTNVFFREVDVIGLENIPKHGPVVFYGNHQNQFMDAVMMRAHCGRPVRFIIAEKSMRRPVIGQFARLMGVVPVIRPQDVPSVTGTGKIISITECNVVGNDETKFTTEVHPGDVIQWSVVGSSDKLNAQVRSIESNTKLTLTLPVEAANSVNNKPTSFKVSRRIDHSEMYAQVYSTLENDGSIGVFPEGGSHDRTSLLPLKAGVALFSLGAAERGIVPAIIPVGLTYFFGHKFRSRAHIEFGEPILPPPHIVEQFSTDKRNATGEFLKQLETALRDVTINCEDYNTLKFIHNFRRLYQDPSIRLETIDYLRLTRRLAIITTDYDHDPDFAEFRAKVENYVDFCNALFVRDAQAATLSGLKKNVSILLFFRRVGVLFVLFFTLVPFFIIAGPVGVISQLASEAHARTALSASSVKVVGADVKASYKIITGFAMFPIMCFVVATVVYYHTESIRSAATVFLAIPMAMYVSLHLVHEFILELYAALPLFISLVSNHKQFIKLHERRQRLVTMARNMVSKFDPALDNEMSVYEGATSPTGPAPSFFSLRHRSRASSVISP